VMLYVCYGLPKSGSTFAANLAEEVLTLIAPRLDLRFEPPEAAGLSERVVYSAADLEDLADRQARPGLDFVVAVKGHFAPTLRMIKAMSTPYCFGLATCRHPGDMIVSLMDAYRKRPEHFEAGRDFESALQSYQLTIPHFRGWIEAPNMLRVRFTDLKNDPEAVCADIASQFGETISAADAHSIIERGKARFHQFNVGQEGRFLTELEFEQWKAVEKLFRGFIEDNRL